MRKFFSTLTVAALMAAGAISSANAAAVTGYGANDAEFARLYQAATAACAGPSASVADCQAALTAYTQALVTAGVPQEVTTASITQLRTEVSATGDVAAIDDLFATLLPGTGSTNPPPEASATVPG